MKKFVLCLVGLFLFVKISYADCGHCDKDSSKSPASSLVDEVKKLGTRILINVLFNELNLSDDQMNKLFEIAKEVNVAKKKYSEKAKQIMEEQVKWYENFKQEDMKLEGFSKEAEQKAGQAEHKGIELHKKFGDELKKYEARVKEFLTKNQIELFESIVQPKDILPMILKPQGTKNKQLKDTTLKLPTKKEKTSKSELDEAREELEEAHKTKYHVDYGNIAKLLALDELVTELAERLNVDFKDEFVKSDEYNELEKKVRTLFSQINLINLMNGMNFSTHQLSHIMHCTKDANEERPTKPMEPFCTLPESVLKDLKECLVEVHNIVKSGSNKLSDSVFKDIGEISKEIFANISKNKPKDFAKMNKETQKAVDEIYNILFESQKDVIYTYNPCLIPPKNLKDPVRVGQTGSGEIVVNMLKKFREIPEKRYNKEEVIERTISMVENFGGKFDSEEREEAKNKLSKILDKVRSMSDVDFELDKEKIAEELSFLHKIDDLKKKVRELTGEESTVKFKIRDNLLNPEFIAIAEVRIKQLKEFNIGKPTNLDEISPAEMCRNGKCAVKD